MYYRELNDLIERLDSNNVEKLKPELKKYLAKIVLSINDEEISEDDLNAMFNVALVREKIHDDINEQCKSNVGLVIDEFINKYEKFMNKAVEEGLLKDAIIMTKEIIKSLGCVHREMFVIRNNHGFEEDEEEKYLQDLVDQVSLELNKYKENRSMEFLITNGIEDLINEKAGNNLKSLWAA